MNASSGIFTAPRNGIYAFHLSGIFYYPTSTSRVDAYLSLMVNGDQIGRTAVHSHDDNSYYLHSLHSTLELRAGDEVWINIPYLSSGASLHDDFQRYTQFTGFLLQEKLNNNMH